MRDADSIAERVVEIKRSLDELKTAQFTSQDSGMKFIQIDPIVTSLSLPVPSNYEALVKLRYSFTPEHDFPVILVPDLNISSSVDMTITEDTMMPGHFILMFSVGGDFAGYADFYPIFHEGESNSKTRNLDSLLYYWFDPTMLSALNVTATFNLRATDSGVVSESHEVIDL